MEQELRARQVLRVPLVLQVLRERQVEREPRAQLVLRERQELVVLAPRGKRATWGTLEIGVPLVSQARLELRVEQALLARLVLQGLPVPRVLQEPRVELEQQARLVLQET